MKDLIEAIRTQLRADMTDVRDSDVYVTPSEDFVPANVRPPCIGIKDGRISREEKFGDQMGTWLRVTIVACVALTKEEAAIMGDDSGSRVGILDLADDIHESLDDNLLGISGMISAFSREESESNPFGDESLMMQRKLIYYEYEKEGDRP